MMFFMASHHLLTLLHKGSLLFLVFFFDYFFPFKDGIQINFLILVYLFEQIDFKIQIFDFYFIYDEFANQRHLHPIFLHFFHYSHVSHSNSLFNHILFSSFHYCLFFNHKISYRFHCSNSYYEQITSFKNYFVPDRVFL